MEEIEKIRAFIDEKLHEIRNYQGDEYPDAYFEGMIDGIIMLDQYISKEIVEKQ